MMPPGNVMPTSGLDHLNAGYYADFVILREDPLSLTTQSTQYMQMRNIPVLETWLGGVPVYTGGGS